VAEMMSNLNILAEAAENMMFSGSNVVLFVVYAFFVGLIIIAAIMFIRFLSNGIKEMKLMRMEVGKLAEELRLLRKEMKGRE
jgi:capsular polysaccharide biosynthesis protein